MRKGRLDIINTCKYLMVIALIAMWYCWFPEREIIPYP